MKFFFNNRTYSVDVSKWAKEKSKPSSLHTKVREHIKIMHPMTTILEEFPLPGTKPKLYADFFLPSKGILYEAHGRQHTEHIRFFHKTKFDFVRAQHNDRIKLDWCAQNDVELIAIYEGDL